MTDTRADKALMLAILNEQERRLNTRKIFRMYPDTGALRRELYPKHLAFFKAGATYRERCFMAANRVGKTEGAGGYEMALHLTGLYPDWWEGRRFDKPIRAWAAGKTNETTRNIVQTKLFGPVGYVGEHKSLKGTGLIPGDVIERVTWKQGIPDSADTVEVRHVSGGVSVLGLKSYQQGRGSFEGTEQDVIWLDEEPPMDIYGECLIRTATTQGMVMLTFTPLEGLSDVVQSFLPENGELGGMLAVSPSKALVMAGWDDVPHLDARTKMELLASTPPHLRDARSKGIPAMGAGAIYPVPESEIMVQPFPIPDHWPRAFGLDVGWNKTAAVWGATDPETHVSYLCAQYYLGERTAAEHVHGLRSPGDWIPGVLDPAARGRSQTDGNALMDQYTALGLDLEPADNAVSAGLDAVWLALTTGQLKVFSTLTDWFQEYRIYRRDEKGRVVKKFDHLMDATRYYWMSGRDRARVKPAKARLRANSATNWKTV